MEAATSNTNDTREQSERMRPVHIEVAQAESIAGAQRLAAMAQEPLPPHIALALNRYEQDKKGAGITGKFAKPAGGDTTVTISDEGRALLAAEQSGDAVITQVGPDPLALYSEVAAAKPAPKRG
jgi:hypothetical protein